MKLDRTRCLGLIALLTACTPSPPPSHARTALLERTADLPASTEVVALEIDAASGFEQWTLESKRKVRLGPSPLLDSTGPNAINFRGLNVKTIHCPGPFDPQAINTVEIELMSAGHTRLFAWFERDGKRVTPQSLSFVEQGEIPSLVRLRFLHNQLETLPFDELKLQFSAEGDALSIFKIRWLKTSGIVEQYSPEWTLKYLDADGRRSLPVGTDSPCFALFEIQDDSEIAFSYGVPPELFHQRAQLRLEVRLTHESGETRTETYPFPHRDWAHATVSLANWSPGEVEAVLTTRAVEGFEGLGFVSPIWVSEPEPSPDTVLFITSDTHRADHLHAANSGVVISTPNLDELAKTGVLFEEAWSSTNTTIPSHSALMTGIHPRDTFIIDNRTALAERANTLAEHFAQDGYTTLALVSTRHLSSHHSGLGQGFERMFDCLRTIRSADETVSKLLEWMEECGNRRLFIWLHLFDAHAPYSHREPWNSEYLSTAKPGPAGFINEHVRFRAHYRSEISFLDQELGRLLSHPRMENAIVAFTADHGESLGAHGIDFQHLELYPDTTLVPLILRWPGGPSGLRVPDAIDQLDLGRTLLDLAKIEAPSFPGTPLRLEALTGEREPIHTLGGLGLSAARLDSGWLAILHLKEHAVESEDGQEYARHQVELFHLDRDPECLNDLVDTERARATRMREQLIEWLRAASPDGLMEEAHIDEEALQALIELGYSGQATEERSEWFPESCDCVECAKFNQ